MRTSRQRQAGRGSGPATTRHRLLAAGAALTAAAAGLAVAGSAPAAWAAGGGTVCEEGSCSLTYTTPATGQSFTIPPGVASLSVILVAGVGGTNFDGDVAGGDGAMVTANLAVSPGMTLGIDVAGAGEGGSDNADYPGGINGGGAGVFSGSGGGATDLTSGGTDLLVAGGGGGAGADKGGDTACLNGSLDASGGAGGNADTAGSPGQAINTGGFTLNGGGGGQPGTTSAVGAGGAGGTFSGTNPCPPPALATVGKTGASGSGGTGGSGTEQTGGGGGGGYQGAGAGAAGAADNAPQGATIAGYGGGGGGASYGGGAGVSDYAVNDFANAGQINGGNGELVLSWTDPLTAGTPSWSAPAGQNLGVPSASGLLSAANVTAPAGDSLTASGPAGGTTSQGGYVSVDADGSFVYTPPSGFTGTDTFGYTVTDTGGDYVTSTATVVVQPLPQAITITSAAPDPGVVNGSSYTPTATGGGSGNPVTFGVDPASTAGACSISEGTVSFTGTGSCVLDASQAAGGVYAAAPQVTQTITVDQGPAFALDSPPLAATAGQVYSYTFGASGTPAPSYALAAGAPSWLAIDTSTGQLSGVPPTGTTSFGYAVTAANPAGAVTTSTYTVLVSASTPKANLVATLTCPATVSQGTTATCTVKVANHGPAAAAAVRIEVALKNVKLTKAGCTGGCSGTARVFRWSKASLADGATLTYQITVTGAKAGEGLLLLEASSNTLDSAPANNVDTKQIRVTPTQ